MKQFVFIGVSSKAKDFFFSKKNLGQMSLLVWLEARLEAINVSELQTERKGQEKTLHPHPQTQRLGSEGCGLQKPAWSPLKLQRKSRSVGLGGQRSFFIVLN